MFTRFRWLMTTAGLFLIGFHTANAQDFVPVPMSPVGWAPPTSDCEPNVDPWWAVPTLLTSEKSNSSSAETCCPDPSPAPVPWKTLFFDNDFRYKNNCCAPYLFGEELKDLSLDFPTSESRISVGGELRFRHINEDNRLRPGGPGQSTYDLWRWRNYIDFHYNESLRGYVEMLDASIFNEELPATSIDLNRWNIQNAFVDMRITELDNGPVWVRFGRQELLYGSQRLVSPLDWGNTRRNFEGFKLFHRGKTWDLDAWATHPVNTAAGHGPLTVFDNGRDKADGSRYFSGAYVVYKGFDRSTLDGYWLWDRESDFRGTAADVSRHTVGTRWQYNRPVQDGCSDVTRIWHVDVEGGYQFGHDTNETVRAGFFTAGLGHTWKSLLWSPTLWLFYDWASGDDDPDDGANNSFRQLFPLGHAYVGLIDNVARQNISDVNFKLVMHPADKLTLTTSFHWMDLDTQNDFIYNVAGVPVGTTGSGTEIGEELDIVANYQFNPNFSMQAGYFWFWYGSAVENSGLNRGDAEQFYLQTTLRY